ncbi:lipase family protein [Speluncibacter jeojiensis]|uniref:lipase family protein n=1 Tax=Speluncibacter jeojiensis TaxID=2710754 RepID=UPI00240FB6F9|nr:lipase family protein [Rhodococcus sp. D2-41]
MKATMLAGLTVAAMAVPTAAVQTVAAASPAPAGDAFYQPPSPLPAGAPGDVIRTEPSGFPTTAIKGPVTTTKVMYLSRDTHDRPIAVTGTVFVPDGPWRGPGPRPLVVDGPGTQGQGDQCAPSKLFASGGEYEAATIIPMLAEGYAVAVTDFEGLGTPGIHPYMNRLSQAHTVIDMGRAALRLGDPSIPKDAPVALWGYSQGGGAVASAVEQLPSYAPELHVVGGFVGAPPADLAATAKYIDGTALMGAIGYTTNGLVEDYPQIKPAVEAALNDKGRQFLEDVSTQCESETIAQFGFHHSSEFTSDGRSIGDHLTEEPIKSVVDAQRIGLIKPTVPVFVTNSTSDDLVPPSNVEGLVHEWCALGADVTYREYALPHVAPVVDHSIPGGLALPEAGPWMADRFAGKPVPVGCD